MSDELSPNIPGPRIIPFEFFSKPGNKTTKLINCEQGFSVEGNNRWYEFEFIEPVYLTSIIIESSGYDKWDKFNVEVFHTDDTIHDESIPVDDNKTILSLGKLCKKFRFKPDTKWLHNTLITQVTAAGYSLEEFHSFEYEIKKIARREQKVSEKEEEIATADADLAITQKEIVNNQTQITELDTQRAGLIESIRKLDHLVKEGEANSKDLQSELETLQEERRSLRSEIATNETTHKELTTKLRLFPSEISGFVEQGNRNIRTYLVIGIPFAAIFLVVLWSLFTSAIDLTQIWKTEGGVDVWTIFLTRVPFVFVAFLLVESCGFIVGRLIFEIVKINRQRLEFSKLSIVAKDITTASSAELDITELQRFEEETKIKMGLLQEHMKNHSADEFKYQGSSISSAIFGLANKMLNKSNN